MYSVHCTLYSVHCTVYTFPLYTLSQTTNTGPSVTSTDVTGSLLDDFFSSPAQPPAQPSAGFGVTNPTPSNDLSFLDSSQGFGIFDSSASAFGGDLLQPTSVNQQSSSATTGQKVFCFVYFQFLKNYVKLAV